MTCWSQRKEEGLWTHHTGGRCAITAPPCCTCVSGSSGCWCSSWRRCWSSFCGGAVDCSCRRTPLRRVYSSRRSPASGPGTGVRRRTCRSRGYSSCWGWPAAWRWWRPCLWTKARGSLCLLCGFTGVNKTHRMSLAMKELILELISRQFHRSQTWSHTDEVFDHPPVWRQLGHRA